MFDVLWREICEWHPTEVQNRYEMEAVYSLILGCGSYLEIGSSNGGSLWVFGSAVCLGGAIHAIDLGELHSLEYLRDIEQKLKPSRNVTLHIGDSRVVPDMPLEFDVVFIDGGHSYEQVRDDYTNYACMAKKLLIFHDIKSPGPNKVWVETGEGLVIADMSDKRPMGYGVRFI